MDNSKFDESIRQKLRELPVPVGLNTRILANAPRKRAKSFWLLVPAVAAVALVVWFQYSFAGYRHAMVKFVSDEYTLDLKTESFDEVRQGFAKNGYPAGYTLPSALNRLHLEGGCLRQWRGHKVALVCMEAKDRDTWLFVIEALPDAPAQPVFSKSGKITTASWTDGRLTYILATEGDEAELKSYLDLPA